MWLFILGILIALGAFILDFMQIKFDYIVKDNVKYKVIWYTSLKGRNYLIIRKL